MRRRRFMEMGLGSFLGAAGVPRLDSRRRLSSAPVRARSLEMRSLGRTGERLSIVGLGGMALVDETPEESGALVREAFENGVNYYDVAPSYGNAEDLLGPALRPYRKDVFLACKTLARDLEGARAELDRSLRKLETDHLDLYQFHALSTTDDVEKIFGPDGAAETFIRARQDGKIRFIGFSAHSEKAALLAMDKFAFDTVLFPINFVCVLNGDFGSRVLDKALAQGLGILALKSLARTPWNKGEDRGGCPKCWYSPVLDPEEQRLALRFTLSEPVTAAVPPGDKLIFRTALRLAREFSPLTDEERSTLQARAADIKPVFASPRGNALP